MSESTMNRALSWWIPHPGNVLNDRGGGSMLLGGVGLLMGMPALTYGLGATFGAMRAPDLLTAAWQLAVGVFVGAIGCVLLAASERALVQASAVAARPAMAFGARAAMVVAALASVTMMAACIALGHGNVFAAVGGALFSPDGASSDAFGDAMSWSDTSHHADAVAPGENLSIFVVAAALLVFRLTARPLMALAALRPRRFVLGWAGITATLALLALAAFGASALHLGPALRGGAFAWRGVVWALALSGVAAAMTLAAQRRLALWDHPAAWRDATVTPDLRIVFADGSGARPASDYFRGYVGPVVVMPTAESSAAIFRGDGAPNDGWVVPGTRAALDEAVRSARAMTRMSVAGVAMIATVPLLAWLVSLV